MLGILETRAEGNLVEEDIILVLKYFILLHNDDMTFGVTAIYDFENICKKKFIALVLLQ